MNACAVSVADCALARKTCRPLLNGCALRRAELSQDGRTAELTDLKLREDLDSVERRILEWLRSHAKREEEK
jgi:hypothetical protein